MSSLSILYQDSDLLIIDKPSGVVVNTSQTTKSETIQDQVASYMDLNPAEVSEGAGDVKDGVNVEEGSPVYDIVDSDEESEFVARGGIVHRLDKDTSGIILVAKNEASFKRLQKQFKGREVHKVYVALIQGILKDEVVEIDAPIKRHPEARTKFSVAADGKPAFTRVEKVSVANFPEGDVTRVNVFPLTGRTHQIRVHLCALNHPVIGDPTYMTRQQYYTWDQKFYRLMLHAHKITFSHPSTGEVMTFESKVPQEFNI